MPRFPETTRRRLREPGDQSVGIADCQDLVGCTDRAKVDRDGVTGGPNGRQASHPFTSDADRFRSGIPESIDQQLEIGVGHHPIHTGAVVNHDDHTRPGRASRTGHHTKAFGVGNVDTLPSFQRGDLGTQLGDNRLAPLLVVPASHHVLHERLALQFRAGVLLTQSDRGRGHHRADQRQGQCERDLARRPSVMLADTVDVVVVVQRTRRDVVKQRMPIPWIRERPSTQGVTRGVVTINRRTWNA